MASYICLVNSVFCVYNTIHHMQNNVGDWLDALEMSEYESMFKREGFSNSDDMEHLKCLNEEELKAMGIKKRG